jgi:protein O-mannosyl-transferase
MASSSLRQRRSRPAVRTEESSTRARQGLPFWAILLAVAACLYAGCWAYAPALRGRFVFDDLGLPFQMREYDSAPLVAWLNGVRPVLMFSYWLNFVLAGREAFSYHLVNVLIHIVNGALVLFILLRILAAIGLANSQRGILAIFGAALFVLHPVQTESVAYVAGRSESLCAMFLLASFAVFIAQPVHEMRWRAVFAIVLLYSCAVLTKEHAVILPAVFVLTDLLFHGLSAKESILYRKRLYAAMAVLAIVGSAFVWRVLATSASAGFALRDFKWHEYFFTQWRVWWLYAGLLVFPVGQNADYDIPVSHSPFDHAAVLGLAGMVILAVAAWKVRERYRLAVFGFALILLFLAPTSSIVPIKDVATERRLYLPVLGLVLILLEWFTRSKFQLSRLSILACVLAVAFLLTYQRSTVWGSPARLWADVTQKSPRKVRAYTHLVYGLLAEKRCGDALDVFRRVPDAGKRDLEVLVSWYYTLDCLGRKDEAIGKLQEAAATAPAPGTFVLIGMAYERTGRLDEAEAAFEQARRLEPKTSFDRTALDQLRKKTRAREN